MAGGLLVLIGLLALGGTVLVVLAVGPAGPPVGVPLHHPGLARLRRVALASRGIGLAAGLGLLLLMGRFDRLGQTLVCVPAVFAAVLLCGVLTAEVMTRRDARQPGLAGIEVRRVRDYLPRPLGLGAAATGVVLAAVMAYTTSVAAADDLGRAGRALAYRCRDRTICDSGSFGPWPGSFYTGPLVVALLLVLALTAAALITVVRRPRNGSEPVVVAVDDAVRRQAASTAMASALFALAGSLAGLGLTAGSGLLGQAGRGPAGLVPTGVLLTAAGVAGLAALCWSVAALFRPLLRPALRPALVPRPAPAHSGRDGRR